MATALLAVAATLFPGWCRGLDFRFKEEFGRTGRGRDQLERPSGIAFSEKGFIAVSDRKRNTVSIYDKNGYWLKSVGKPKGEGPVELDSPEAVEIDDTGRIWVADTGNDRVVAISQNGGILKTIGEPGMRNGQFDTPVDIAFGGGRIFVADYGNRRVQYFDGNGIYLGQWSDRSVRGDGPVRKPVAIAFSDEGRGCLWIANEGSPVLRKMDMQGFDAGRVDLTRIAEGEISVADLVYDSGMRRLFVLDKASSRIFVLGIGMNQEGRINIGTDSLPSGMAVNWSVDVYVVDERMRRVRIYERY